MADRIGENNAKIYEFEAKTIDGDNIKLGKFRGNVLLIVNVASKCSLTAQNYKELNEIYATYLSFYFTLFVFINLYSIICIL